MDPILLCIIADDLDLCKRIMKDQTNPKIYDTHYDRAKYMDRKKFIEYFNACDRIYLGAPTYISLKYSPLSTYHNNFVISPKDYELLKQYHFNEWCWYIITAGCVIAIGLPTCASLVHGIYNYATI